MALASALLSCGCAHSSSSAGAPIHDYKAGTATEAPRPYTVEWLAPTDGTGPTVGTISHTFGTHAAMFGVNPWTLMTWMGHKTIAETMRYVHVANAHRRPIPEDVLAAPGAEVDPDRCIVMMLGSRGTKD